MMVKSLVAALIALAPIGALAQAPTAPPDDARPFRVRPQGPAERDWEDATTFMREHAPYRWQAVQLLPEEGPMRRSVMAFIVARYRALQEIKRDDPKIYDIKLSQLATEDEIYGLIANLSTPEEREKHREELRLDTRKLLDLNLMERERRIERLKTALANEESKLADDRSQLDAQVSSRTNALVADGTGALRKEMFPNRPAPLRRDIKQTGPTTKVP